MKTTLAQLLVLNPCAQGSAIAATVLPDHPFGAAEARAAGVSFEDVVWGVSAIARTSPQWDAALQQWLDDCAAHARALAGSHYSEGNQASDERDRQRDFERSRLDAGIRAATRYAARVSWAAADMSGRRAAQSALSVARAAGMNERAAAQAATKSAWQRARADARRAEDRWQFDRLVAVIDGTAGR